MSQEIETLHAELATVAMKIAGLLRGERYDEAELAELAVRRDELRARISEAETPVRSVRAEAACIQRRT